MEFRFHMFCAQKEPNNISLLGVERGESQLFTALIAALTTQDSILNQ